MKYEISFAFTDPSSILESLCQRHQCWGLYISFATPGDVEEYEYAEILKAAPYLVEDSIDQNHQFLILTNGHAYLLFNTEAAMQTCFKATVGDNRGLTTGNDYSGPARVYAITCSPEGHLLNENT